MKLTVRKADGPGWLMIIEVVEASLYKVLTERCGDEPSWETIKEFLNRVPRLLDNIKGAPAGEANIVHQVSYKRAARMARKELEHERNGTRLGKSFQVKQEELEKAAQMKRETIDLTVWIKPGKKRAQLITVQPNVKMMMEVTGALTDGRTNAEILSALKKYFGVYDRDIELVEGYSSQCKKYRILLR